MSIFSTATDSQVPERNSRALSARPLRVGLVGVGSMGKHHARVLSGLLGVEFVGICDTDAYAATEVSKAASTQAYHELDELIGKVDALFIATPTTTHYEFVRRALQRGKHVLVEKPLAESAEHARQLADLAEQFPGICAVGHVERFNPVVQWLKTNLDASEILSINITRVGPRPPRIKDVGIIVDLAVHDIDLISFLTNSDIADIHAVVHSTSGIHEDVAQINIRTTSNVVCGINTNWLTPFKSRKIEIATAGAFFVGDLVQGTVTKYFNGDKLSDCQSELFTPSGIEPLVEQANAFLSLVRGETRSANATFREACHVVELASQCLINSRSIAPRGKSEEA